MSIDSLLFALVVPKLLSNCLLGVGDIKSSLHNMHIKLFSVLKSHLFISELSDIQDSTAINSKCDEKEVTSFIQKYVKTAYLKSESNREIHYILPYDEAKKGNFDKLFSVLDENLHQFHVSSYGVMDMTLEEVFLKVTEMAEEENGRSLDIRFKWLNLELVVN